MSDEDNPTEKKPSEVLDVEGGSTPLYAETLPPAAPKDIKFFSGPLPPASEFADYDNVYPGAAEKILTNWDLEISHRHEVEKSLIESNNKVNQYTYVEVVKKINTERMEIFVGFLAFLFINTLIVYICIESGYKGTAVGTLIAEMAAIAVAYFTKKSKVTKK